MTIESPIPVIVNGAGGKMGREVIKHVAESQDMILIGAVDINPNYLGKDIGELAGIKHLEIPVINDLESILITATQEKVQGVMVDFTHPNNMYNNIRSAIAYGVRPVVGTTGGLTKEQLKDLEEFADKASTGCLIIPNFSIGIVLLQKAAIEASKYFDDVEIIESHHNHKIDAPSGTAIQTAEILAESGKIYNVSCMEETETIKFSRGCLASNNIRVHSIRLPGLIAHQEVIFGSEGQVYTLRHDTSNRTCYMPGILLAIRQVTRLKSLVYGLEKIL
ncbi:4-hydroxy-tetrahydrodipicolinate reductase [Candidatus Atelocyanobacterium thalassae]|uniref:4-hydroxy-tetrahydrodipicolinate reductase n=1 Tax=cyanobacterium endosymbiont of Braarudosphaera bigelowii TaxID=1285375 RepID=A0ABM7U429_9CHRO|nr:4-hydroxy-tetrahydrodipicolinate reductase [Candidatus Atelocyanobacterium thalassa]BDA39455.1 4-hydroxy-tetrahydrodipicolinate reductase [cyanobacterium endosymbiont of Braarudosphaera bigelowii]